MNRRDFLKLASVVPFAPTVLAKAPVIANGTEKMVWLSQVGEVDDWCEPSNQITEDILENIRSCIDYAPYKIEYIWVSPDIGKYLQEEFRAKSLYGGLNETQDAYMDMNFCGIPIKVSQLLGDGTIVYVREGLLNMWENYE